MLLPCLLSPAAGQGARAEVEGLLSQGETALREGRADEAARFFSQALALDPEDPRIWNYQGGVSFFRGEFQAALDQFGQAARRDPHNPRILNNLGTVCERLGKPAEALEQYLAAIAADPEYAEAYRNLGAIYAYRLRDAILARHYWTKYLELAPDGPAVMEVRDELDRLDGK